MGQKYKTYWVSGPNPSVDQYSPENKSVPSPRINCDLLSNKFFKSLKSVTYNSCLPSTLAGPYSSSLNKQEQSSTVPPLALTHSFPKLISQSQPYNEKHKRSQCREFDHRSSTCIIKDSCENEQHRETIKESVESISFPQGRNTQWNELPEVDSLFIDQRVHASLARGNDAFPVNGTHDFPAIEGDRSPAYGSHGFVVTESHRFSGKDNHSFQTYGSHKFLTNERHSLPTYGSHGFPVNKCLTFPTNETQGFPANESYGFSVCGSHHSPDNKSYSIQGKERHGFLGKNRQGFPVNQNSLFLPSAEPGESDAYFHGCQKGCPKANMTEHQAFTNPTRFEKRRLAEFPKLNHSANYSCVPPPPPPPPTYPPPPPPDEYNPNFFSEIKDLSHKRSKLDVKPRCSWNSGHSSKRGMFECQNCDLNFSTDAEYQMHVKESHIPCAFPGCSFSANIAVVQAHELKHIRSRQGVSLFDDPEESKLWLEARKRNHPLAKKNQVYATLREDSTKLPLHVSGGIEKILRLHVIEKKSYINLRKRVLENSAFFPEVKNLFNKRPLSKLLPPKYKRFQSRRNGSFTEAQLRKEYPICQHFKMYRTCKWKICNFSHDLIEYRHWKIERNRRGLDVRLRPSLIYELLLPEIRKEECKILQILSYLVSNNFFMEENVKTEDTGTAIEICNSGSTKGVENMALSSLVNPLDWEGSNNSSLEDSSSCDFDAD